MPRPDPNPIYTAFINHELAILSDADREHLAARRGFPAEVIDLGRYKSARPENAQIIAAMQETFDRDQLIDAGLLQIRNGAILPNPQLLEPGQPLIPYLCDDHQQAYHLRRHKNGFKGVPIGFYCAGSGTELVLTESEFKAAASYCFGTPAIGIPGISSFVREHFSRLMSHLIHNGITKVTVVFDNEIKNDPALPNYKADPDKRWDTQYYAMLMAMRIAEHSSAIETLVATLPDAWRENGKIDIDGALAQGRTAEQFSDCLAAALRPEDYLNGQPDEAQAIIRRKLRGFYLSLHVRRTANGYEVLRETEQGDKWEPITNFTFDIIAKLETAGDGIVRMVRMRQGTRESDPFRISASDMVKPDNFQAAFYRLGTGEAWYKGSKEQLTDIFDLEHNRGPVAVVVEPDHVGKIAGKDMWLFGDGALMSGNLVHPDANRIFWNGVRGYCVPACSSDEKENETTSKWVSRVPHPDFSGGPVDILEVAKRLYENFGAEEGGHNAVASLCWGLSCAFSHDLFDEYGCFPILYLRGLKETGKSTLARWLLRMYGVMHPGFNAPGATLPGICRILSYYSSIPVFLDECREDVIAGTTKESLFRSAYDRQPVLKAAGATGTGVTSLPIRSPIMMAGEHSPKDAALITRCIFTEFSAERKTYGSQFRWLDDASRKVFPKVLPWLLKDGPAALDLVAQADTFRELMQSKDVGIEPRAARNYSILLAIYNTLVDPTNSMGLADQLMNMAKTSGDDQKEDSDLHRFFEDLPLLRDKHEVTHGTDYMVDGGLLFMNLRRCWEQWQKRQRDIGSKAPSLKTALMLLRSTKFVERASLQKKIGGINLRCVSIYLDPSKGCPECLIDFALPGIRGPVAS